MSFDTRKKTGNEGEIEAAEYLISKGYSVITKNFRNSRGEIDIIASMNDILVFVEVKTLPNGTKELLSRVLNKIKQQRIIKTAQCFLSIHRQYSNNYVRFDVIVVDMPGLPRFYHIENAFVAEPL